MRPFQNRSVKRSRAPETEMRAKKDPQSQMGFHVSEGVRATTRYFARYEAIDVLLDRHPEILAAVHGDLEGPLTQVNKDARSGRPSKFTSDTALRIVLVKLLEDCSFREVVIRVDDSVRLRAFTRLHNDPMMDFSTLCGLTNSIRPETWAKVNELLAEAAVAEGRIDGKMLRLDTTAVETNVHFPTDSHQLFDAHRVVSRIVRQIREMVPSLVSDKRLHDRAAKKLHTKIARARGKKSDEGQKDQMKLYVRLIRLVRGVLNWVPSLTERVRRDGARHAGSVADAMRLDALLAQLERFRALGVRCVDLAHRRVVGGEQIPNDEKLFSIFEPHTELLIRGKAAKPIEFGHMVSIHQVEGSFIIDYQVHAKKPSDFETVDAALARHVELFGAPPKVLAADKGYWESTEKTKDLSKAVECVSIGKKGRRTARETAREHGVFFRLGQKFRAGVEGTISYLKLALGMARCMNKGWQHFAATVGATVFAHNLIVLARGGG